MNREAYMQQLIGLLPTGQVWNTEIASNTMKLVSVIASELEYIDSRAQSLLREALPSTTIDLLEDWEKVAGLPDSCSLLADTHSERVEALVSKITRIGGQSRQFFIDLAESLGYHIEITELTPFMCGISPVGTDHLTEDHDVRFVWYVTVLDAKLVYLRCGQSTIDRRLLDFRQADDLACIFLKLKPAHTELIIGYEGV
ncbi:MAG: putative phage tail protein [Alphaproteobacteria bacterium]|nr:putative phage tail protein [Alphaproteobacteria bacterium]